MIAVVKRKRFWFAAIVGLTALVYTIRKADLGRLTENLQNIDYFWGVMALAASAVSYICIAAVLYWLLQGMGYPLPFTTSFRIALVSTTLNYVMAIGGLSGMAAKVYLLAKERVAPSSTLSISVVHGFLTNTVAVILVYLGFFFLYSKYKLSIRQIEFGIFVLVIALGLTWGTIQVILHESFRKTLWTLLMRTASILCRTLHHPQWLHQHKAEVFFANFNESLNILGRNARILLAPASFALLDWIAMFLCLKWAFEAVHYPVDNLSLLVGFSVGIFTGIFSLTPASIGLMEGSMAGSFYLMGLDYDRALIATLIYRFAYFLLPILLSLFFYKHFFPTQEAVTKEESKDESSLRTPRKS